MFASVLITFRETIEAALVVGIILTYLTKTNQQIFKKYVWRGVGLGIISSILLGLILEGLFGGFQGKSEQIFEGVLMLITAGFITWMIMWIHKQKDVAKKITQKIARHIEKGYGLGIFILVATSVLREGTETVLYLKASSILGQSNQLIGAALGICLALVLGFVLFRFALRLNLSLIFNITSIFLILFAAGLVSHGVHEFQEIGMLPVFSFDPVFNIAHVLDHNSIIGSLLRTLFGYTSRPTSLEIFSYTVYVVFILWLQRTTDRAVQKM